MSREVNAERAVKEERVRGAESTGVAASCFRAPSERTLSNVTHSATLEPGRNPLTFPCRCPIVESLSATSTTYSEIF